MGNAERQARFRRRRDALARANPDVVEGELERQAERSNLSGEERTALADRLADLANRHLFRAQELARLARRVRGER